MQIFGNFIRKYCYASLYYPKHPEKIKPGINFISLELNKNDYFLGLFELMRSEEEHFISVQNIFLKHLNLPYDKTIVDEIEEDYEDIPTTPEEIEFDKQWEEYFEQKSNLAQKRLDLFKKKYPKLYEEYEKQHHNRLQNYNAENNIIEISGLINSLALDFTFGAYYLCGYNLPLYNIPYCFCSSDVISILAIEFKEFISDKRHVIKQCKNCGRYFIPENLRDIKYCNNIFKDNKTCKELGKQISYKKSLKDDELLDMYRKRYLSLASSVSHYGTEKAIEKFENYKKEGAVMKKKYLNKEISGKDFEKWIENSKKQ